MVAVRLLDSVDDIFGEDRLDFAINSELNDRACGGRGEPDCAKTGAATRGAKARNSAANTNTRKANRRDVRKVITDA